MASWCTENDTFPYLSLLSSDTRRCHDTLTPMTLGHLVSFVDTILRLPAYFSDFLQVPSWMHTTQAVNHLFAFSVPQLQISRLRDGKTSLHIDKCS